jgi:hypothetical protein
VDFPFYSDFSQIGVITLRRQRSFYVPVIWCKRRFSNAFYSAGFCGRSREYFAARPIAEVSADQWHKHSVEGPAL